jgi:hypothetical protein
MELAAWSTYLLLRCSHTLLKALQTSLMWRNRNNMSERSSIDFFLLLATVRTGAQ